MPVSGHLELNNLVLNSSLTLSDRPYYAYTPTPSAHSGVDWEHIGGYGEIELEI